MINQSGIGSNPPNMVAGVFAEVVSCNSTKAHPLVELTSFDVVRGFKERQVAMGEEIAMYLD